MKTERIDPCNRIKIKFKYFLILFFLIFIFSNIFSNFSLRLKHSDVMMYFVDWCVGRTSFFVSSCGVSACCDG
jgi:hypothetical protein